MSALSAYAAGMANDTPIEKPMSKTAIYAELAESTQLTKKQVQAVFDGLDDLIRRHLMAGGAGSFALPGLLKIKTVAKPAQEAKFGVPNPFKPGETMDVAAKPASIKVKVSPLKKLKEMPL